MMQDLVSLQDAPASATTLTSASAQQSPIYVQGQISLSIERQG